MIFQYCECFLIICYGWISHPFLVVVFMVSVPVGYIYLGRRDLVAGRLAGYDGNCLSSILFLAMIRYVVEYEL